MKKFFSCLIILALLLTSAKAGPATLTACCVAACTVEIPPVDGGVGTAALIATCSGFCLSSGGAVVGYAGPVCVWAAIFLW